MKKRIIFPCHGKHSHECKYVGNVWWDLYYDLTQHYGSCQGRELGLSWRKRFFLLRASSQAFLYQIITLGSLLKRLTASAPDSLSLMDLQNQDFKKTKIKPDTVVALKLCFEKQGRYFKKLVPGLSDPTAPGDLCIDSFSIQLN